MWWTVKMSESQAILLPKIPNGVCVCVVGGGFLLFSQAGLFVHSSLDRVRKEATRHDSYVSSQSRLINEPKTAKMPSSYSEIHTF